jgi:hypothetical protein
MSILIKGMEMPQRCKECDLHIDGACYAKGYRDYRSIMDMSKPADCPLIEVPTPHGELVDRDGLMDTYADRLTAVAERYSPDSSECGILSGAMKLLAIMPTLIEAED